MGPFGIARLHVVRQLLFRRGKNRPIPSKQANVSAEQFPSSPVCWYLRARHGRFFRLG